jgi:hypothetical protein
MAPPGYAAKVTTKTPAPMRQVRFMVEFSFSLTRKLMEEHHDKDYTCAAICRRGLRSSAVIGWSRFL